MLSFPGVEGHPVLLADPGHIHVAHDRISQIVPQFVPFPSYLKDTTHFLQKISAIHTLPPNTLLVTLDVTSLYINIPHHEGIAACSAALATRNIKEPPTDHLTTLISYILRKNNFVFGEMHYIQTSGTSMSTWTASSYANLIVPRPDVLSRSATCKTRNVIYRKVFTVCR